MQVSLKYYQNLIIKKSVYIENTRFLCTDFLTVKNPLISLRTVKIF